MAASVGEFVERLADEGQLARIAAEVDGQLEAAAIVAEVARRGGPAVLFERVRERIWPLAVNLLGSERRVLAALGIDSRDELCRRAGRFVGAEGAAPVRSTKPAAAQQVVRLGTDVDLSELPLMRAWPSDAHFALHGAVVVSVSPESGRADVEVADLVMLAPRAMAGWWGGQHGVGLHLSQQRGRGPKLAVAIVAGGPPSYTLAASAPRPAGSDPWAWAGHLAERPVELVAARTQNLEVPADADVIIEGYLDPDEEPGPVESIGSPRGIAYPPGPLPVIHVTAVTHRAAPVVTMALAGGGPNERLVMQETMAAVRLALIQRHAPAVCDLSLPAWGGFESLAVVAVDKRFAGDAWRAAHCVLGSDAMADISHLVVVDAGTDLQIAAAVCGAIAAHARPARDVQTWPGPQGRLVIDATRKLVDELGTPPPPASAAEDEMLRSVRKRAAELGLSGVLGPL